MYIRNHLRIRAVKLSSNLQLLLKWVRKAQPLQQIMGNYQSTPVRVPFRGPGSSGTVH